MGDRTERISVLVGPTYATLRQRASTDFKEVLPELGGGAPQRAVLANKAVGGLCGWNSILMFGIPIATWPIYA